jgi:hypothetical protein
MANSMHTNRNRCENLGSSGNRAMQLKNFSNFLLLSKLTQQCALVTVHRSRSETTEA